jgi:hypothetical protein
MGNWHIQIDSVAHETRLDYCCAIHYISQRYMLQTYQVHVIAFLQPHVAMTSLRIITQKEGQTSGLILGSSSQEDLGTGVAENSGRARKLRVRRHGVRRQLTLILPRSDQAGIQPCL